MQISNSRLCESSKCWVYSAVNYPWWMSMLFHRRACCGLAPLFRFSAKKFHVFLIFAQNIDCGYTLEPPRRGGSNEYPQSMFWSKNKKNRHTPAYPSFAIYKWGSRGYTLHATCSRDNCHRLRCPLEEFRRCAAVKTLFRWITYLSV